MVQGPGAGGGPFASPNPLLPNNDSHTEKSLKPQALMAYPLNRAHMAYDHGGIKAFKAKPSGGRHHENTTLVEEYS